MVSEGNYQRRQNIDVREHSNINLEIKINSGPVMRRRNSALEILWEKKSS